VKAEVRRNDIEVKNLRHYSMYMSTVLRPHERGENVPMCRSVAMVSLVGREGGKETLAAVDRTGSKGGTEGMIGIEEKR
jgi:hypothetical protein